MSTSGVGASGSVIDVQGVVSQLMQIEQRPLNVAKQRVSTATVSISAMSDLKSKLDALSSSVKDMEDSRMLAGRSVSSSDATLVKASVTSDTLAAAGSYTVTNATLASAQITQLPGFNDKSATLYNGTLTFGDATTGGTLGIGSSVRLDFGVPGGTGITLDAIRDQINADPRLSGKVTASVVNNGVSSNPYSLVLTGAATGTAAGFTVTPTAFTFPSSSFSSVALTSQSATPSTAQKTTLLGFSDDSTTLYTGTLNLSNGTSGNLIGSSVALTFAGKTLNQIIGEINSDPRLTGKVTAVVNNDPTSSNPWYLELTGAVNGADFRVVPSSFSSTASAFTPVKTDLKVAANASATVNGLPVQSKTNTFNEAIGGLSFDVLKADSSLAGTTITVTNNKSTLKERVKSFAANLSSLYTQIDALTKPGSASEKAGPLAGNSAILSLRLALSTAYNAGFVITGTSGLNSVYRWSDLGLEVQRNGSVTVREADLASAIDGATTIYGGSRRIGDEMLGGFTSSAVASQSFSGIRASITQFAGTSGTIQSTIDTLNLTKRSRETDVANIQSRLDATRKSLIAKYAALDAKLAKGNQLLANVQSSLGSLRA